ncbi:hypothetical protein B0H10DRAFT_2104164, partial [Mycena sp. CBHHK59/15]
YEIGRLAAEAAAPAVLAVEEVSMELVKEKKSKRAEEAKKIGFAEGRQAGFEEGHESAMTADVFALSFEAGKTAGLASGMESGRETEEKRWKDTGHFADDPGTFNWADDAESLPIHTVLSSVRQPRDFSGLRSGSTNPFDTTRFSSPQTTCQSLVLTPCSKVISEGQLSVFVILVWFWMMLWERVALG